MQTVAVGVTADGHSETQQGRQQMGGWAWEKAGTAVNESTFLITDSELFAK